MEAIFEALMLEHRAALISNTLKSWSGARVGKAVQLKTFRCFPSLLPVVSVLRRWASIRPSPETQVARPRCLRLFETTIAETMQQSSRFVMKTICLHSYFAVFHPFHFVRLHYLFMDTGRTCRWAASFGLQVSVPVKRFMIFTVHIE